MHTAAQKIQITKFIITGELQSSSIFLSGSNSTSLHKTGTVTGCRKTGHHYDQASQNLAEKQR